MRTVTVNLKEHYKILYYHLLITCELLPHLAEVEKECNECMGNLVRAIVKQKGVIEPLNATSQMA